MELKKMHILLTCNLGASTGIMANKMKEVAQKSEVLKKVDIRIEAQPGDIFSDVVNQFDVVLVAPQMMHRYKFFEQCAKENNVKIAAIDPRDYGTVNAGNIIKTAIIAMMEE